MLAQLLKRRLIKIAAVVALSGLVIVICRMPYRIMSQDEQIRIIARMRAPPAWADDIKDPAIENMLNLAQALGRRGKEVPIAIANSAYVPFAHSWLCNTMFMGIHDQIIVVVPDELSRKQLRSKWPKLHVFRIASDLGDITDDRNYSTMGFMRITYFRAYIIRKLLEHGVNVFVFEFDAVWFENPIPHFRVKLGLGDIAAVHPTGTFVQVAIGLLYIRSTNSTIAIWAEIKRRMDNLLYKYSSEGNDKEISEFLNDQLFLEDILHYGNYKVVYMNNKVFADGLWYSDRHRNTAPVLINNNWIIGPAKKMKRAIQQKHWFWNMTLEQCDIDLVKKTLDF